ncbi:DUF4116 domain-containing protein [Facilibium subflavum]|uniref:DUF4116 domain-containing protein n=1 Tax=Facilibium subflavum TaxID=2219058 RepID=UPI000E6482D8|nr:DUF4116 domain-containing protein [Facilibium subflavum]
MKDKPNAVMKLYQHPLFDPNAAAQIFALLPFDGHNSSCVALQSLSPKDENHHAHDIYLTFLKSHSWKKLIEESGLSYTANLMLQDIDRSMMNRCIIAMLQIINNQPLENEEDLQLLHTHHAERNTLYDIARAIYRLRDNKYAAAYLAENLKTNLDIAKAALQNNGFAIQYFSYDLIANNPDIAMLAVTQNGLAIKYLAEFIEAHPEIAIAAVKQTPFALQYLPDAFLEERPDIAVTAFHQHGDIVFDLDLIPASIVGLVEEASLNTEELSFHNVQGVTDIELLNPKLM